MVEINAIGDVLRNHHTKNEMVEDQLKRMDQPLEQEIVPEDIIEQIKDTTKENAEDTVFEIIDNLLVQILASKRTTSIYNIWKVF